MSDVTTRVEPSVPELDAVTAAQRVPDDATVLVSGFGSVGYPKEVPAALASSDRALSLTIVSGGSVGPEIDVDLVEAGAIERRFPYQARRPMRDRINQGDVAFHDRHIARLGDEVQFGDLGEVDVAIVEAVAVGEDWLVPSTSVGQTPAYVDAAPQLIVEVNHAQPLELQELHDIYRPGPPPNREPIPLTSVDGRIGDSRVRFDPDQLVGVVGTDRPDEPYTFRAPTDHDLRIAANLASFLDAELERNAIFDEAVNVQFGVGSLGNALMRRLTDVDFGDRSVAYFGEVIQDGLLDMLDDGLLGSASATSLALSEEGQRRLFDDIDAYAEDILLRPADISNNPALINRFGVVGVNSALEVDVYGNVNSTHLTGTHILNGVGGSGDFNRHSPLAITALPSTAADGDVSRIVPMVPHVDHTEHDVAVVVTEQGIADLRGRSPRERAAELVEHCAHPRFHDDLREYVETATQKGGNVPHDLERALSWHEEWRSS